jgi:hypothetical protein
MYLDTVKSCDDVMACDAASTTIWYAVSNAIDSFSQRVRALRAQFDGSCKERTF